LCHECATKNRSIFENYEGTGHKKGKPASYELAGF
jgi:hypothetical protein